MSDRARMYARLRHEGLTARDAARGAGYSHDCPPESARELHQAYQQQVGSSDLAGDWMRLHDEMDELMDRLRACRCRIEAIRMLTEGV